MVDYKIKHADFVEAAFRPIMVKGAHCLPRIGEHIWGILKEHAEVVDVTHTVRGDTVESFIVWIREG